MRRIGKFCENLEKDIEFSTNFIKKLNKIMMWEKVFPFFLFIFSWFDLHTDFNVISGQLNISTIIFRCVYNNFFIAWNFFFSTGCIKYYYFLRSFFYFYFPLIKNLVIWRRVPRIYFFYYKEFFKIINKFFF